ncbi:unnamed protein product [Schistosoma curassoni]|uniref:Uncharacterized protein n=1 Tax=Schistosoma curassoni TaxID=6186 RepID=A0A183KB85_9TREM|nr:unnamed protein product [Schistosoma curassoni]
MNPMRLQIETIYDHCLFHVFVERAITKVIRYAYAHLNLTIQDFHVLDQRLLHVFLEKDMYVNNSVDCLFYQILLDQEIHVPKLLLDVFEFLDE